MTGISTSRREEARSALASPLARLEDFAASASLTTGMREVRRMVAIIRRFMWTGHVRGVDGITPEAITAYLCELRRRGRSEKTLANHLSAISRFCDFLKSRRAAADNPCRLVRLRRPEELLPRYLDVDEVAVVLVTARANGIWPEVCLALSTGLRLGELARLQWSDIDRDRRTLTVRKSKSRRPRVVPLSEPALAALAAQRRKTGRLRHIFPARQTWRGGWRYVDKPRGTSSLGRAFRPIQDAVPKFRDLPGRSTGRAWHLLRHSFASRAAQAGVSPAKLRVWLGHSDIRTVMIYAHLQAGYDQDIEAAGPLKGKTK